MSKQSKARRMNVRSAMDLWGRLPRIALRGLRELTDRYGLSIALGDLLFLDGKWHVTHAGLLRLAQRRHCVGIKVQQVRQFCDPSAGRWVFKAAVYKNSKSRSFVGYGDADPANTSPRR